jgi:general secretion pathway protein G
MCGATQKKFGRCSTFSLAGFTLIELLVVMAIIATLLAITSPRYFGSVDRSKEVTLKQDLSVMRDAIDKFYGDTGAYPESLDELALKKYLQAVPVDPITDSSTSWQTTPPPDGKTGSVYTIKSGASGTAHDGSNYQDW